MLAELGYPSTPNNMITPWDIGSVYSASEQQRAYVGAFANKSWVRGLYIWDWYANPTSAPPASRSLAAGQARPPDGHRLVLTRSAS